MVALLPCGKILVAGSADNLSAFAVECRSALQLKSALKLGSVLELGTGIHGRVAPMC